MAGESCYLPEDVSAQVDEQAIREARFLDWVPASEQKRIAELMGYEGEEGVAPVEKFMQQYFKHTSAIRNGVGHFVAGARWSLFPGANLLATFVSTVSGGSPIGRTDSQLSELTCIPPPTPGSHKHKNGWLTHL